MTKKDKKTVIHFDEFSDNYDEALLRGLSLTGEGKDYYAEKRLEWLKGKLEKRRTKAETVIDFGCGTGTAIPLLFEILGAKKAIGLDVSAKSLEVAEKLHGGPDSHFYTLDKYKPTTLADLVFCNGVFHHIEPSERKKYLSIVHQSLKTGGFFAFWENNPWNPGTRLVMKRCPFDQDAKTLSIWQAKKILMESGFTVKEVWSLFYFPKIMASLRFLEPFLARLPLGGQYLLLAEKAGQGRPGRKRQRGSKKVKW